MTKEQAEILLVQAGSYAGRTMPLADFKGNKLERTYDCEFTNAVMCGTGQPDNMNYHPQARMKEVDKPEVFHYLPLKDIIDYLREHPKTNDERAS
jgi:hypothetical protein